MSCAILLTEEELSGLEGDVFSKVRFKAPINPADGELYGQIWKGNDLVSEIEVEDFTAGEWVEVILETFAAVDITEQYYVGYKIHTLTGDLAYHDAGPRVAGKGAFMRTGGWTELAASLDYNFCIEAVIISQNFGTISGSVDLNEGNGNIIDVAVKADNYMSHPDADGNYILREGILEEDQGKSKMKIANESIVALMDHLNDDDRFGVVLFDDSAYLAKELNYVGESDMDAIKDHILEIRESGGTNMEAGMELGSKLFDEVQNMNPEEYENRIIFLTDAMPNTGDISEDGLTGQLSKNADDGIYSSFIGIGFRF